MKAFEYKTFFVDSEYDFDLMYCLNRIGKDGWECVQIQFQPDRPHVAQYLIAKKEIVTPEGKRK